MITEQKKFIRPSIPESSANNLGSIESGDPREPGLIDEGILLGLIIGHRFQPEKQHQARYHQPQLVFIAWKSAYDSEDATGEDDLD